MQREIPVVSEILDIEPYNWAAKMGKERAAEWQAVQDHIPKKMLKMRDSSSGLCASINV